jgi:hypothetical protein
MKIETCELRIYYPHPVFPPALQRTTDENQWDKPILEATDTKSVRLIILIPVNSSVRGIQIPSPSIATRNRRRPEVRVRTEIGKGAISIAVTGKLLTVANYSIYPAG